MPTKRCCCLPTGCPQCTNITHLILSGLSSGGYCVGGCENRNGTYIFRSAGDAIPSNCQWTVSPYSGNNCGHTCPEQTEHWYIGGNGAGCCFGDWSWIVALTYVGTAVKVTVEALISYQTSEVDCTYGLISNYKCGHYSARWEKEFADCASISGALPLVETSYNACDEPEATPDLCNLFGAIVEIG